MTTYVTDGGFETDLIFNRGIDLPEFAAFPFLDSEDGRTVLRDYYAAYVAIAARAGAPLLLETPPGAPTPTTRRRSGTTPRRSTGSTGPASSSWPPSPRSTPST